MSAHSLPRPPPSQTTRCRCFRTNLMSALHILARPLPHRVPGCVHLATRTTVGAHLRLRAGPQLPAAGAPVALRLAALGYTTCAEVQDPRAPLGSKLSSQSCNGSPEQTFALEPAGSDWFRVRAGGTWLQPRVLGQPPAAVSLRLLQCLCLTHLHVAAQAGGRESSGRRPPRRTHSGLLQHHGVRTAIGPALLVAQLLHNCVRLLPADQLSRACFVVPPL